MEDMGMDQVVDVPDTPDRLARHSQDIRDGNSGVTRSILSVPGNFKVSGLRNEEPSNCPRGRDRPAMESNGCRRLYVRSQRNIGNAEENGCHNLPSGSSCVSRNAQSSGRIVRDNNIKYEQGNLIGAQKGKSVCSNVDSKSPAANEDDAILNFSKHSTKTEIPKLACQFGSSHNQMTEEIRKGKTATDVSSLHRAPHLLNTSSKSWKGKEKTDSNTCEGAGSTTNSGKLSDLSYDSQRLTEKQRPAFLRSMASPRVTGRKRLVRNGCISPHNIATRAKEQTAESQSQNHKDVDLNHTSDMISDGLPCVTYIREIVAEENDRDITKGKGLLSHVSTSKELDNINFKFPPSSMIDKVEANATCYANGDACRHLEELGGWRSTRNRMSNIGHPLSDSAGNLFRRNDASNPQYKNSVEIADDCTRENTGPESDFPAGSSSVHAHGSRIISHLDWRRPQAPTIIPETSIPRRQKPLRNNGECSTSVPDNSEIVCLESSAPTSQFGRRHGRENSFLFYQVIEIDELSPEVRHNGSQARSGINSDDQDSRAIQLQADEMLARELQEQLYNEVPVGGDESDEHIALAMQHEDAVHTSSAHSFHNISLPDIHSASQPLPLSSSSSLRRLRTQVRNPTSTRRTRLRNRFSRQSAAVEARQGNLQFPLGMPIEMRLDILEAVEAAYGDSGVRRGGRHVLQPQRDFNENDYEMLLALDENNHHVGANANQINALPVSTVQTENLEEACVICLEAPTMGDTIRHLPCLHKFHKDCIDRWLSRSTSCPVCKSSIT